MSGTPKGKIECFHNTGNIDLNGQEMFANLYDFWKALETAGYATEIANNWGSGGSGFDYHDGVNPSGNNAFFVFKMNLAGSGRTYMEPYYLIQYSDTSNFGSAPGNPGLMLGSAGTSGFNLGFQVAWAFEADGTTAANPWKGGTVLGGADTKGSPVWDAPGGGTVHVFPRSNNAGGSHNVNRENCAALFYNVAITDNFRVHMLADRDAFFFILDTSDDGDYDKHTFIGQFTPRANTTWDHPYMFFSTASYDRVPPTTGFNFGDTAGTDANQAGVMLPDVADGVKAPLMFTQLQYASDTSLHPSAISNSYDEIPFPFMAREGDFQGMCGQIDEFLLQVYNFTMHDTNVAKTRVGVGGNIALTNWKWTMPWDGATTPRSGVTRQGVDF